MFVVTAFAVITAVPAYAASPRVEIEAANMAFATSFNQKDDAAVAAHYSEDAALFPPDAERVDGRADIQAFWKKAIEDGMSDLTLKAVEVEGSDDVAFEVGEASFSAPNQSGTPAQATIKYIVVWRKGADDTWRIYRDIWNSNPAK
jgi:uncharacterized protein (TIGR02246 family)